MCLPPSMSQCVSNHSRRGCPPGEKITPSSRLDRLRETISLRERRGMRPPIGRRRLERRSYRRLWRRRAWCPQNAVGGWELVLLVGIDWADTEHVYCLMDESGSTLATGTIDHTAEDLEHFMA